MREREKNERGSSGEGRGDKKRAQFLTCRVRPSFANIWKTERDWPCSDTCSEKSTPFVRRPLPSLPPCLFSFSPSPLWQIRISLAKDELQKIESEQRRERAQTNTCELSRRQWWPIAYRKGWHVVLCIFLPLPPHKYDAHDKVLMHSVGLGKFQITRVSSPP